MDRKASEDLEQTSQDLRKVHLELLHLTSIMKLQLDQERASASILVWIGCGVLGNLLAIALQVFILHK